jgi:hypothetical protein
MNLQQTAALIEQMHRPRIIDGTINVFHGEKTLLGTYRKFCKVQKCRFIEFKTGLKIAAHKKTTCQHH